MAIVTYNDNGTIKVVKFGNYVVSTDADPVAQKQWVWLDSSTGGTDISLVLKGLRDPDELELRGCANPYRLRDGLTLQHDPNGLDIGTRASVRLDLPGEQGPCGTWAIFEVQEV